MAHWPRSLANRMQSRSRGSQTMDERWRCARSWAIQAQTPRQARRWKLVAFGKFKDLRRKPVAFVATVLLPKLVGVLALGRMLVVRRKFGVFWHTAIEKEPRFTARTHARRSKNTDFWSSESCSALALPKLQMLAACNGIVTADSAADTWQLIRSYPARRGSDA